jgi:uncharacterized DUF497 family protein
VRFEWDEAKSESNRRKHGVSFEKARELFESATDHLELFDPEHSTKEDRFIAIGAIESGVVVVSWSEPQEGVVRIISARMATRGEVALFWRRLREFS